MDYSAEEEAFGQNSSSDGLFSPHAFTVEPAIRENLELSKDFILDYTEYKHVLEDCNKTLHQTSYPQDGKFSDCLSAMSREKKGLNTLQKVSTQVSLRNPRRLIWVDTFCYGSVFFPSTDKCTISFNTVGRNILE